MADLYEHQRSPQKLYLETDRLLCELGARCREAGGYLGVGVEAQWLPGRPAVTSTPKPFSLRSNANVQAGEVAGNDEGSL